MELKNNSYSETLDQIINDFRQGVQQAVTPTEISTVTTQLFKGYSDFIKTFFCGRENEIKKIYEGIRNDSYPFNKITMIDVNMAIHCYSDYFTGLLQFANKISDLKDSDSVNSESVSKTLEMVKSKDKAFVDSLFGGEMNPSTTTNIDTAMVTVEAFIQLDRNFDEFVLVTKSITNDATVSNSTKYNDQVLEGIRIFVSSFGYYNFRCIKEIIKTYNDIIDSMTSRTPASGVKEVETYQLF